LSLKNHAHGEGAGEGYFCTRNHQTFGIDGLSHFFIHPGYRSSEDPDFDRIPMDQGISEATFPANTAMHRKEHENATIRSVVDKESSCYFRQIERP
jgi:hypothetical protein